MSTSSSSTSSSASITSCVVAVLFTLIPTSVDAKCMNLTASLTVADMTHYFFTGNEFSRVNILQALASGGSSLAEVKSISDWDGMAADVHINAGYLEPGTGNMLRLFDTEGNVYKIDVENKKVVEKLTLTALFKGDEMSYLSKGIQAAATFVDGHRMFFSGCHVLKTDFKGNSEKLNLKEAGLPCDVDSAMTYPRKNDQHLFITKGARAYGWFLTNSNSRSMGYDMFCVKDKLSRVGLDFCGC